RRGHLSRPVEPSGARPVFCQGWYGDTGTGRYMSETHAPFWIYGSGKLRLEFAPSTLPRRITVDGRPTLELVGRRWHLVTVDVPRLVSVAGEQNRVGLKLVGLLTSSTSGYAERLRAERHQPLLVCRVPLGRRA